MRLNDPQIELVHDDPFMGYIETARAGTSGISNITPTRSASLLDIETEEDVDTAAPTAAVADEDDDDEDVDVGENSRPIPDLTNQQSPKEPTGNPDGSSASVRNDNGNNSSAEAGTDPSIVIVLLVE